MATKLQADVARDAERLRALVTADLEGAVRVDLEHGAAVRVKRITGTFVTVYPIDPAGSLHATVGKGVGVHVVNGELLGRYVGHLDVVVRRAYRVAARIAAAAEVAA